MFIKIHVSQQEKFDATIAGLVKQGLTFEVRIVGEEYVIELKGGY